MKITHIDIWKLSIPMHPFRIATGTMHYAQNMFIRIHTDENIYGCGECSAFPMITGETQNTCFEMARDFASLWKGRDTGDTGLLLQQLDLFTAHNYTAKSAFDMALHDLSSKKMKQPLYKFLGGEKRRMETDLTVGIDEPGIMADKAREFVNRGVRIIKIKLGKNGPEDVERVKRIRNTVGNEVILRIDANQGWSYEEAAATLAFLEPFDIEFCEQPMRTWNDHLLPELKKNSPIPIMADESVFTHHDASRLIHAGACDYINIKLAKSGGITEARRIHDVCAMNGIPCMMGGMLESRMALTAFAHVASAFENIRFYDMDTCMLGHKNDPVTGGVQYNGFFVELPDSHGIGADISDDYLEKCEHIRV